MNSNNYLNKSKGFYISMILNLVEGLLSGVTIGVILYAIEGIFNNGLTVETLKQFSIELIVIYAIRLLIYSIGYTMGHTSGSNMMKNIRLFLGQKMRRMPLANFSKIKGGEYIKVVTTDINNYENILTHKTGDVVKSMALIVIMIGFLIVKNPSIGIVNLLLVSTIFPAMKYSTNRIKKYGTIKNDAIADNISDVVEYTSGIQTFRAYNMGGVKNTKTKESLKKISDTSYKYEIKIIGPVSLFNFFISLSVPISILMSGNYYLKGSMDIGSFIIFLIIPIYLAKISAVLAVDVNEYRHLIISRDAIDVLGKAEEEKTNDLEFKPNKYDIEFNNVDFSYEKGEPVLRNVSFKAKNGKITAIIGDSGSGKTTILNLLSKFYEIDNGDIKIGEVSIKDKNTGKVLEKISMVDQDTFLFNDTIKNNIRYARQNASDEEIIEACKKANCHEFISGLTSGYDTIIEEEGNNFSGGEKQRISIARAILKDSPILLLDEATASLDIENELAVKEAIKNLLSENKTVIMIAHNLSIIRNADNIVVMSGGYVVENGKDNELLRNKNKYYQMLESEKKLNKAI